jgi:flagellar protein FliS
MSNAKNSALNAYSQISLDAKVASASPHLLITMLFDGAIAAIARAKFHMGSKAVEDIAEKGSSISRAIAIIDDGLKASLNVDAGGELANNLLALYEYMSYRLIQANLNNDEEILNEVSMRLTELRDAWESIGLKQTDKTMIQDQRTVSASGTVTYGRV